MQLSHEGSGCGGRSRHRHHHHLRRILPATTPPTASAEIATITVNPADVAIAAVLAELLLVGERKCYGRRRAEALPEGRAEALPEGARGGVTGGGGGRHEGPAP